MRRKPPLTIEITAGGGPNPVPIWREEHSLRLGDKITVAFQDIPLVVSMPGQYGDTVPVRLKHRGRWYEIGAEVEA